MYKEIPPLAAVRAFEAAARHQSFSRAADEMAMTQAAVSYQVRLLEQRLGIALFLRQPRRVVLTSAGESLARACTEAFALLRAGFAELRQRDEKVLAVTTLPTVASNWLAPRLGAFHLGHPALALRLDTSVDSLDLAQAGFDAAIRYGDGNWPGLQADLLLAADFTPLCTPAALREHGAGTPRALLRAPLFGRPDWWARWFDAVGIEPEARPGLPAVDLSVQQFEMAAAVAAGGFAIVSPVFFRDELLTGRLVQPFDAVIAQGGAYWFVCPAPRRNVPKIRAFRDWILGEAERTAEFKR